MTFLYTGAYTKPPQGHAGGIDVYRFDDASGSLEHVQTVGDIVNPSFLAATDDGRYLYAVCEEAGGAVAAFSRDAETGKLTPLNSQSSEGAGPCYVSVDASGRYALVANYGAGSIAALPIDSDGSLQPASSAVQHEGSSVNPDRQQEAHAHMIASTPDGKFVLASDLGMDKIVGYSLDTSSGALIPMEQAGATARRGAGPRHFAFSPDGATVYVINELNSTLTVYDYDKKTGALNDRQTLSALPEGYEGESWCAQVLVSPDGRFVYGSNRGHDSIAIWQADTESGEVTSLGQTSTEGEWPRHFTLDPTGRWLLVANQHTDSVTVFRRNEETGLLTHPTVIPDIPSAVALLFCGDS